MIHSASAVRSSMPEFSAPPPEGFLNAVNRDYALLARRVSNWVAAQRELPGVLAEEAGVSLGDVVRISTSFGFGSLGHNRVGNELIADLFLKSGGSKSVSLFLKTGNPGADKKVTKADFAREMSISAHLTSEFPGIREYFVPTFLVDTLPESACPPKVMASFAKEFPIQADRYVDAPTLHGIKTEIERQHRREPGARNAAVQSLLRSCVHGVFKVWDVTRKDTDTGIIYDTDNVDILVRTPSEGKFQPVFIDPDYYQKGGGVLMLLNAVNELIAGTHEAWVYDGFKAPRARYWSGTMIVEELCKAMSKERAQETMRMIAGLPPTTDFHYIEKLRVRQIARKHSIHS